MFRVADYIVKFGRIATDEEKRRGRWHTICEIKYVERVCVGGARLHPKDMPDRIIGKKIALANALKHIGHYFDLHESECKRLRAEIWTAFWAWIKSWKEASDGTDRTAKT